jgi:hypothetical protein
MSFRLDILENVLNFAVRANDKRGPRHPHHFPAIHVLFLYDPEGLSDVFVGVGQQGEGKVELIGKIPLRLGSIGRNAKQHGAGFLNLFIYIAEPASLDGSTGRVGARVEE